MTLPAGAELDRLEQDFARLCDEFLALLKAGKIDAAFQRHEQAVACYRDLKRLTRKT